MATELIEPTSIEAKTHRSFSRFPGLILVTCCVILMQAVLISISFPITELWTDTPLFHNDAAFHWYEMKVAVDLAQEGKLTGYDPFFGAGYLGGIASNPSAKLGALVAIMFHRWASEIVIYKVLSILAALLAVVCIPLASRWLELDTLTTAIASAFGFLLWWASWFRWFHTTGMVAFVFASYLFPPYLAGIVRYFETHRAHTVFFWLCIVGAFALFYHPLFLLPVMCAAGWYVLVHWRTINRAKSVAVLLGLPLLILLPNLIWLYPVYRQGKVAELTTMAYQSLVDVTMIGKELLGWYGKSDAHGSPLYAPLLLASLWGCIRSASPKQQRIAFAWTSAGLTLVVFAAVGAVVTTFRSFQPNRFAPVGYLLLTIPAAMGLAQIIRHDSKNRMTPVVRWTAQFLVGVFVLVGTYMANELRREMSPAPFGHYGTETPEVKGLGTYSGWILPWLNAHTTKEARVLFEDSKGRVYDGAHILGYYAFQSDREFIGGPFPFHHFAGFWDSTLFRKPIGTINVDQMQRYLELYNVGWIIVHSEDSKRYFDSMPGVVPLDGFREIKTYMVIQPLSFFISGAGRVIERGHNRIVLADLTGDEIILKYHFVPGLRSDPPATLVPVYRLDDPDPFLRIINPPSQLTLKTQ